MKIEGIDPLQLSSLQKIDQEKDQPGVSEFGEALKNALNNVNKIQQDADQATQDFLLGKTDSVHKVTVAAEKAQLAMDLTISIRDRLMEAHRELMRMQF